jgi:hypothetical protein
MLRLTLISHYNPPGRYCDDSYAFEACVGWTVRAIQLDHAQWVAHKLIITELIHRLEFAFKDMEAAYTTFGAAFKHKALKVLIQF